MVSVRCWHAFKVNLIFWDISGASRSGEFAPNLNQQIMDEALTARQQQKLEVKLQLQLAQ